MTACFCYKTNILSASAEEFVPSVTQEDKEIYLSEKFGFNHPTKTFHEELVIPPFTPKYLFSTVTKSDLTGTTVGHSFLVGFF